jgi:hypothetical protein
MKGLYISINPLFPLDDMRHILAPGKVLRIDLSMGENSIILPSPTSLKMAIDFPFNPENE